MATNNVSGPTKERFQKSYEIRRAFKDAVQCPPEVPGVRGAIDVHCHADQGHQDGLALAKHASQNSMGGILFKSIVGGPQAVKKIQENVNRFAEEEKLEPVQCWAGYVIRETKAPSLDAIRSRLSPEVVAIWMPVALHANTLSKVGGRKIWWDPTASRNELTPPLPWEEALKIGHYLLDKKGNLKPLIRDILHLAADAGKAFFFGHATHAEIFAMAEEVEKIGFKRAVVDHPFSPFVDLSIEQMKLLANVGIYLNFTYDELSPLLGIDPHTMYQAIRAIGVEYAVLSSDAGEPLFPNTVEAIRLMRAYMRAFGLNDDEIHRISTVNPAAIVGIN
jgi:hypothetical protein